MASEISDIAAGKKHPSKKEEFLNAVEKKLTNDAHRRLLKAFRGDQPMESAEAELRKIILEIVNET